jgi:hypothetical protein
MKLSLALVATLLLAGCNLDSTAVLVVTSDQPKVHGTDPNALAIAQGTAVGIEPFIVHEEIEGASEHVVDDARPDDPTILRITHATRDYGLPSDIGTEKALVILGLRPGTTTLHFYRDGDEVGSTLVQVVAQDP